MNNFLEWNIDPVIIDFHWLSIRWYGIFFAIVFIFGLYFMRDVFVKEKKNIKDLENLFIYIVFGTIIGARLAHCIFYEPLYTLKDPLSILRIWEGGLASHGGGIGIVIGIYIFKRRRDDYSFLWITDNLTIPVAFGGILIRLGNFFNSEIVGLRSEYPWSIVFKRIDDFPRHPSQLYESLLYFIIFIIIGIIYKKTEFRKKEGILTGLLLLMIFSGRFVLEFLKMKQESYDSILVFNTGQLLSIPVMIIGIVLIIYRIRKENI
ncbi:MAG: prolipoprotein diacylglyceryl transferase [Desulfobacterales bacterium]|nr:prolipoprotein diacylglyceryl transferase [Desulfobacterales bacterium]